MKKKRLAAILLTLILVIFVFKIPIRQVLNWKQIVMFAAGTGIFYLLGREKKNKIDTEEVSKCAMLAGYLIAFVLIIVNLQNATPNTVVSVIGENLCPILYAFCIWFVLGETKIAKRETKNIQDYYQSFQKRGLTKREVEIAILIVKGMTNAEIAYELSIAETTVKKHITHIFEKLEVNSREELKKK